MSTTAIIVAVVVMAIISLLGYMAGRIILAPPRPLPSQSTKPMHYAPRRPAPVLCTTPCSKPSCCKAQR